MLGPEPVTKASNKVLWSYLGGTYYTVVFCVLQKVSCGKACKALIRDSVKLHNQRTELEIAVDHWPFSDQFAPFGRANPIC